MNSNSTKFKNFYTISESAQWLTNALYKDGKNVISEADVFRLALDGYLKISVNFVNGAKARRTKEVTWEETEWLLLPKQFPCLDSDEPAPTELLFGTGKCPPKLKKMLEDIPADKHKYFVPILLQHDIDNKHLTLDQCLTEIAGVWDLPMVGSEQLDVEYQYQQLTGGPVVTKIFLAGVYVKGEDGVLYRLQEYVIPHTDESKAELDNLLEYIKINNIKRCDAIALLEKFHAKPENDRKEWVITPKELISFYCPADALPADCVFVIRNQALLDFEKLSNENAANTETCDQRRARLKKQVLEEKAKGTKAFLRTVANGEKISISRLKQLIEEAPIGKSIWGDLQSTTKETVSKKSQSKY